MKNTKGLIALDIDGTITHHLLEIPRNVVHYLNSLYEQGWVFIFITGRTFDFGYQILKNLQFDYYYAVQNGAILLQMPQKKILLKSYLNHALIPAMEKICANEPTDFVIYAGLELNNQCFYRKKHFSNELLQYLQARREAFNEDWTNLNSFEDIPIKDFPSLKCFGDKEIALRIANNIEQLLNLHVPVIKDPFCNEYYVVQATHPAVSKGQVLKDLVKQLEFQGKIIAAGDDLNDLSMFDEADIKIAMENAPEELKSRADIIAPPASMTGIIDGLKKALQL